jgi:hypothetical protein
MLEEFLDDISGGMFSNLKNQVKDLEAENQAIKANIQIMKAEN